MNFFVPIRDWAFGSLPRLFNGVRRSAFSSSARLIIITIQCGLLVALLLSLAHNVKQAHERSDFIQAAYVIGFRDGGEYLKAALIRAEITSELIEEAARQEREQEAAAHIAEEKL